MKPTNSPTGLNERWALVGEYDEFDEYNAAGIKWRAYVQAAVAARVKRNSFRLIIAWILTAVVAANLFRR